MQEATDYWNNSDYEQCLTLLKTTKSKSTDIEISNVGIELKTLIEKVREQIQNIE